MAGAPVRFSVMKTHGWFFNASTISCILLCIAHLENMAVEDLQHLNGDGHSLTNGSACTVDAAPAPYVIKSPAFRVHRFEASVMGHNITVEVLKMKDSVYIWVGLASQNCQDNMCLSMPTRFNALPLTTPWFGESDATVPTSQKLSTKLKKPIVLSFNIADHHMIKPVEQVIFNDIKNNPEAY